MKFKKLITNAFCITFTALACHSAAQVKKPVTARRKVTATATKKIAKPLFATAAEIEEGKVLITGSDCLACHSIENKLVGPTYTAIAEKYPQSQSTVNTLSEKIVNGGTGVWGTVPMIPHPSVTLIDANKMVKYILTLNSKTPPSSK